MKSDKGLQKRIQRPLPEKGSCCDCCHFRYARGDVALKDITSKKDKKLAGQERKLLSVSMRISLRYVEVSMY